MYMKFVSILFYQRTGGCVTLHGIHVSERRSKRHFYADTAGPRADVPENIGRFNGKLCECCGANLLLCHGCFAADEDFIRQPRHTPHGYFTRLYKKHT